MCFAISCLCAYRQVLKKEGVVSAGLVKIENINYVYSSFELSGEGKTIALIDNYIIKAVPEDPSHTFLILRTFLDQNYIVREDYEIPTEGKVNCAYIDGKRITADQVLNALTDIIRNDNDEGTPFYISNNGTEKNDLKSVVIGYEDCPVGTDYSIYGIGKIDDKWAVVLRNELGTWDGNKLPAIYHELDTKCREMLSECGIW